MALVFDGTANSEFSIANGYTDLFSGKTAHTFTLWFKPVADDITNQTMLWCATNSVSYGLLEVKTAPGFYWVTNGTTEYIFSHTTGGAGAWQFLACTVQASANCFAFSGEPSYTGNKDVNFSQLKSKSGYGSGSYPLIFGGYNGSLYYGGSMYDMRVWDRCLKLWELRKVWSGADVATNLTAHWKMDESSGTTMADSASTYDGTIDSGNSWDGDAPTYGTLDSGEEPAGGGGSGPSAEDIRRANLAMKLARGEL